LAESHIPAIALHVEMTWPCRRTVGDAGRGSRSRMGSAVTRLPAILRMVVGQDVVTAEDRDTAYYLRTTLIVAIAVAVGVVLQWRIDVTSAWIAYGVAYLTGGWRIALDSWAELKRRRLSIDFLMGAAAVGA